MPYIHAKTSLTLSDEQKRKLTKELGEAIKLFPGKSERWLMLEYSDGLSMAFASDSRTPALMLEVSLYGRLDTAAADKFTAKATEIFEEVTGIRKDRMYIKYSEHSTWGFSGENF